MNMQTNQDTMRAAALQKAKRQTAMQSHMPIELQKKQLDEEMKYFKKKLLGALDKKDVDEAEKYIKTLITLRSKKLGISFKEEKEREGLIFEEVFEKKVEDYYEDCYKLINAAETILT